MFPPTVVWRLGRSPIHRTGVYARTFIPGGSNIGQCHAWNGRQWSTTTLGAYHNHSTTPNTRNVQIGGKRFLLAERDIYPGEEITVDYRRQPDLEQPHADWR